MNSKRDTQTTRICRIMQREAAGVGDKHCFGETTTPFIDNGKKRYRKPRSLRHEHFFFGETSPLRSVLALEPADDATIFALHIEFDEPMGEGWRDGSGIVDHVPSSEPDDAGANELLRSFGAICGYASAFGMMDLILDNIVIQRNRAHIIDCEGAFFRGSLHNSGLVPMMAGFPSPLEYIWDLAAAEPEEGARALLEGYWSVASRIVERWTDIQELIRRTFTKKWSVRVMARHSQAYARHLADPESLRKRTEDNSSTLTNEERGELQASLSAFRESVGAADETALTLTPEEKAQIDRGDVPIFWMFPYGGPREPALYYPKDSEGGVIETTSEGLAETAAGGVWDPLDAPANGVRYRVRLAFFELATWALSLSKQNDLQFQQGRVAKKGVVFRAMLDGENTLGVEEPRQPPYRIRSFSILS